MTTTKLEQSILDVINSTKKTALANEIHTTHGADIMRQLIKYKGDVQETVKERISEIQPNVTTSVDDKNEIIYLMILCINRNEAKDCRQSLERMIDYEELDGKGVEDFLNACWDEAESLSRESVFSGLY